MVVRSPAWMILVAWTVGSVSTLFGQAKQPAPAATKPAATKPAAPPAVDKAKILIRLSNDANKPEDRIAAALELLKLGAFDELRGLLTAGSPAARTVVCTALRTAPPPQLIDALIAQLSGADVNVAAAASLTLAAYPDNGVSQKLMTLAKDTKTPLNVRTTAVGTLGLMHDNVQALIALVGLISDVKADTAIRKAARIAIRGEEYQILVKSYKALSDKLMGTLDANGQVKHQLENLTSPIPDIRLLGLQWAQTQKAANALKADSPIVAQVRGMIGDPDEQVRLKVVELLTAIKDPKDAAGILAQYKKENLLILRKAMLEALGSLGSSSMIPAVIEALKDPNEEIAVAAAGGLGQMCANIKAAIGKTIPPEIAKSVADALIPLGTTPEAGKRHTEALAAMAKIGHPSFGPVFTSLLGHKDVTVRRYAVSGIGVIGEANLLGALRTRLTQEPDAGVRLAIIGSLGTTDEDMTALHSRLDPKTEGDEKVRTAASQALMRALESRSPADMRAWAAKFAVNSTQRLALLAGAEVKLTKANPAKPADLTACRIELADTYMAHNKPADAAAFYGPALDNHLSAPKPDAKVCVPLTGKLMAALVAGNLLQSKADMWAKYAASPVPGLKQEVGKALLAHLHALAKANQHPQTLGLVDLITSKVPDRFGGDVANQIAAAELAASRALVQTYLPQLKDAKQKAAASKALVALGKRAVRPLAEQWKAILAAKKPDAVLEKLLIEVLLQVEPTAKGKKFESKEQKEAFIAPLLK